MNLNYNLIEHVGTYGPLIYWKLQNYCEVDKKGMTSNSVVVHGWAYYVLQSYKQYVVLF